MAKKILLKILLITSYIILIFVLLMSVYLAGQNKDLSDYVHILSIVTIIQFIINLIYLKITKINIFSPVGFFIVFLYIFNFGQFFLKGLINNYSFSVFDISLNISDSLYVHAGNYSLTIIALFMVGVLLTTGKKEERTYNCHNNYFKYCKPMGYVLLIIAGPIMLYIDIRTIIISLSRGYLATYSITLPGFLFFFADMVLPAILLLLFAYKENRSVTRSILLASVIYKIFSMVGGHRSSATIFILVLFYIYHKSIENINFKNLVPLILSVFIILITINTFGNIRAIPDKSISMIYESFMISLQDNIILRTMEELGGTLYTAALAINYYPSSFDFLYGTGYIKAFATILPNIGGILNFMGIENWALKLSKVVPYIGGSFIAELYCNFGMFSYLFAVLFGFLISKCSEKYEQYIKSNAYIFIAMYSLAFSAGLFWVRDNFDVLIRSTLWCAVLVYLIYRFIKAFATKPIDN